MESRSAEKRAAVRRRTLKGGRIIFQRRGASIDCIVRDLSETGACLQVESQAGIPSTFELFITDDKSLRTCRVAWRSAKRIGVVFT
jgi:hypothetical protein